ncbi:MAG: alcohol dehydrogenase catalytic domain-containing protein [bacterium]
MNTIPKKMKALCLKGKGEKNLQLCDVPVPLPEKGQILCRVDACTACASDTKLVDQGGDHSLVYNWDTEKYPLIVGHEASLTVVKSGPDVEEEYPAGTRCALQPAIDAPPIHNRERYINNGLGIEKIAVGYTLPGTMAEYVLLTEEVISTGCLLPLPDSTIPHFAVCLTEPFSCVVSAQERMVHFYKNSPEQTALPASGVKQGGITVIIGAGPMGIMHTEIALTGKPKTIIVSELIKERRDNLQNNFKNHPGKQNTEIMATHPDQLEIHLKSMTESGGADDIIIASGSAKLQEYSLGLLAKNGVANFFGGTKAGESQINVDTRRIHYDSITMVGTSGGDPSHVACVLSLLKEKKINPGSYISAVGGMNAALPLLKEVRNQNLNGKGVIYPHINYPLGFVEKWDAEKEKGIYPLANSEC